MKELSSKEQMDEHFEKGQTEAKNQMYRNKSIRFILRFLVFISIFLNLVCFILSPIYHEMDALVLVGMLAIIIFQTIFWLCFLKEHCFYYFQKAIANYYYQGILWAAYLVSETLFMGLCPVSF